MQEIHFHLFLNRLRLLYSIPKLFALLLAFHCGRHSFANIARQKKANVYDISKALGHSSLSITEAYLSKFDVESQDATIKQVFKNEKPTTNKKDLLEALKSLSPKDRRALLQQLDEI